MEAAIRIRASSVEALHKETGELRIDILVMKRRYPIAWQETDKRLWELLKAEGDQGECRT